jgi:hypothetical protein
MASAQPACLPEARALLQGRRVRKRFLSEDGSHAHRWFTGTVDKIWFSKEDGVISYTIL